jgi:hypothetical protein
MSKLKIVLLINFLMIGNVSANVEEEICMTSAEHAVNAAQEFYVAKKGDIATARQVHNSIVSWHMKRIEKSQGTIGKNEMLVISAIDKFTKYGICEAYRKKSGPTLIKLNAYNTCKELLKRDFQIGTCLD